MSALSLIASAARTAGTTVVSDPVDTSTASVLKLTLTGKPSPASTHARLRFIIETSSDAVVWHSQADIVWNAAAQSGPEAYPPSSTTTVAPILADAWARARLVVEPGSDWASVSVTGTMA